jgi:hypothetical protein
MGEIYISSAKEYAEYSSISGICREWDELFEVLALLNFFIQNVDTLANRLDLLFDDSQPTDSHYL